MGINLRINCWICKYYIRPKPILFGLGQTKGFCKKLNIPKNWDQTCKWAIKSKWKTFWDRIRGH